MSDRLVVAERDPPVTLRMDRLPMLSVGKCLLCKAICGPWIHQVARPGAHRG